MDDKQLSTEELDAAAPTGLSTEELDSMEIDAAPTGLSTEELDSMEIDAATPHIPASDSESLPPNPLTADAPDEGNFLTRGLQKIWNGQKWVWKNVVPAAVSSIPLMVAANPLVGIPAAGITYGLTNLAAKKALGTEKESAAALSELPGDVLINSLPMGGGMLGKVAAGGRPAIQKLAAKGLQKGLVPVLEESAKLAKSPLYAWLGGSLGWGTAESVQRGAKESAQTGKLPSLSTLAPSGMDAGVALLMGGLAEGGSAFLKSLATTVSPEFALIAQQNGESVPEALYGAVGEVKDRMIRFLSRSEVGQQMMKSVIDPEKRRVVQKFFENMGFAPPGVAPSLSGYLGKIRESLSKEAGAAKDVIKSEVSAAEKQFFPKEMRPQILNEIISFMEGANKIEGMGRGRTALEAGLHALGASADDVQNVMTKNITIPGTDNAFIQQIKNLRTREQASKEIGNQIVDVLAPVMEQAKTDYQLVYDGIKNSGLGRTTFNDKEFLNVIGKKARLLEESLDSLKFTAGPTAGIVKDVLKIAKGAGEGKPGRFLTLSEAVELAKDVNHLIIKSGGRGEVAAHLGELKSSLYNGIQSTLTKAGEPAAANAYKLANEGYAKMSDQVSPFSDILDQVLPGWDRQIELTKSSRNPAAAVKWFDRVDPAEINLALDALGNPDAKQKILQLQGEAELRGILENASYGKTFDADRFLKGVQGSKRFTFDQKRDISLSALRGVMDPDSPKLSTLKSGLMAGNPHDWSLARAKAKEIGATPQQLETIIARDAFFRPATKNGVLNRKIFIQLAEANPELVAQTKLGNVVKILSDENKSILDAGIRRSELIGITKALANVEDTKSLARLVLEKQQKMSPERLNLMLSVMDKDTKNTFTGEILNYLVHQGGPDVDLPEAVARLQPFFSPVARDNYNPEAFRVLLGDKKFRTMKTFMDALNRLNSYGISTKETLEQIIYSQAGHITPFTARSVPGLLKGTAMNLGSRAFLGSLLKSGGLSDQTIRGLTQSVYATLAKTRSAMRAKEKPANEK